MRAAIVAAAGYGARMGVAGGKQYLLLSGIPILARAVMALEASPSIEGIIIVVNEADVQRCRRDVVAKYRLGKVLDIVPGGPERQRSVSNGLSALPEKAEIVAVHDGARPLVAPSLVEECFEAVLGFDGAIPAIPAKDTPKVVAGDEVERTLNRDRIWLAQTPQVFFKEILVEAHRTAERDGFAGTDDASLVERIGGRVRIVRGSEENIKVTTPVDLVLAEAILRSGSRMAPGATE